MKLLNLASDFRRRIIPGSRRTGESRVTLAGEYGRGKEGEMVPGWGAGQVPDVTEVGP